jgi:hypothetical protein
MLNNTHKHTPKDKTKSNTGRILCCHTPYKYLLKNTYFYAIMLTLFIPTFAATKKTHFTLFFHINQSFKKWKV